MSSPHLGWAGWANVRHLGGLPLSGGGVTRWGSLIRADSLDRLAVFPCGMAATAPAWAAFPPTPSSRTTR
jgi:hypothetical protein